MAQAYSDQQLQSYLDESLPSGVMASIEEELRSSDDLRQRLIQVAGMREAGIHGLGEIWRRNRLSCPTREQLGSFVLGAMDPDVQSYVEFHLETIGCRLCKANFEDLQRQRTEQQKTAETRRRRFFQTSVGQLGNASGSARSGD